MLLGQLSGVDDIVGVIEGVGCGVLVGVGVGTQD